MQDASYTMLLVEDNALCACALHENFCSTGFQVTMARSGEEALAALYAGATYDVVLLDVVLPRHSGFDVLRALQTTHPGTPVLLMSAYKDRDRVLKGFELGATDYLLKPFSLGEVNARIEAILRRTLPPSRAPMDVHHVGDVEVNFSTHLARRGNAEVTFTPMEYALLYYLLQHPNQVVSRRQILRDVWGIPEDVSTRTIDRHIASLRQKIDTDDAQPGCIETVYGTGYRLHTRRAPGPSESRARLA